MATSNRASGARRLPTEMPSLAVFQRYIQRANELETTRFLSSAESWTWGLTLCMSDEDRLVSSTSNHGSISAVFDSTDAAIEGRHKVRLPDRDDLDAFLLRFRRFVAQGEMLFLPNVYNLAEKCLPSGFTSNALRHSRTRFERAMRENYPCRFRIAGRDFEPQECAVRLWIQGDVFHDNEEKRELLGIDKMPEVTRNLIIFQFIQFALNVTAEVLLVRGLLKRAIRHILGTQYLRAPTALDVVTMSHSPCTGPPAEQPKDLCGSHER